MRVAKDIGQEVLGESVDCRFGVEGSPSMIKIDSI